MLSCMTLKGEKPNTISTLNQKDLINDMYILSMAIYMNIVLQQGLKKFEMVPYNRLYGTELNYYYYGVSFYPLFRMPGKQLLLWGILPYAVWSIKWALRTAAIRRYPLLSSLPYAGWSIKQQLLGDTLPYAVWSINWTLRTVAIGRYPLLSSLPYAGWSIKQLLLWDILLYAVWSIN